MSARILVIEDEFLIAQFFSEALKAAGFEVAGLCPTVPAALARLADGPPCDAAVLDASLRNVSSLPVAETLAERGVPFAVVTGFSVDQLPARMAAAPVLSKPLRAEALISVLRELLAPR